jgi:hypothetical protein
MDQYLELSFYYSHSSWNLSFNSLHLCIWFHLNMNMNININFNFNINININFWFLLFLILSIHFLLSKFKIIIQILNQIHVPIILNFNILFHFSLFSDLGSRNNLYLGIINYFIHISIVQIIVCTIRIQLKIHINSSIQS